ncbi:MAG: hypothetical protein R3D02_01715 [Hyphomicrobiales bacterium]
MASRNDDNAGARGGRKKSAVKPITIDLEATEVKPEEPVAEAAAEPAPATGESVAENAAPEAAAPEAAAPEGAPAPEPGEPAAESAPEAAPAETTADAAPEGVAEKPAEAVVAETKAPETKADETKAARQPVRTSGDDRGIFRTVIAAVIGGGAALAANFALEEAGVLPFGPSARIVAVEETLARVDNRVTKLAEQPAAPVEAAVDTTALSDRIAALEEKAAASAAAIGELQAGRAELENLRAEFAALAGNQQAAPATDATPAAEAPAGEAPATDAPAADQPAMAADQPAAPVMAAPAAVPGEALDKLAAGLAAVGERLTAAEAALSGIAPVAERVTAIESSLAKGAAGEAVATETLQNAIATLSDRLAATETKLGSVATPADIAAAIDPLKASLAAAGAAIEAVRTETATALAKADAAGAEAGKAAAALLVPGEPDQRLVAGIDEVTRALAEKGNAIAALDEKIAGIVAADPGERIAAVESGVAAAGEALNAVRGEIGAVRDEAAAGIAAINGQLGEIGGRVAGLETSLGDGSARERAAVAVAVSSLQSAVARGGTFATELAAVAGLGGDETAVAALAPYAEAGLPTAAALAKRFDEVADAVIAASAPAPAPAPAEEAPGSASGILTKFLSNAKNLVHVQPTGPVAGNEAAAVVSRIRAALGEGHLAAALAEWEALPETGKAASADWAGAVKARIEADRMVAEMVDRMLSSLAAPASAPAAEPAK